MAAASSSGGKLREIMDALSRELDGKGLEAYPFKIQWYNERVQAPFKLPYTGETLAVLILNTPEMYRAVLKPFIEERYSSLVNESSGYSSPLDPVDQCFKELFLKLKESFSSEYKTHFIQDYEILPNRRPKILLQTAGHVSGAARYYQRGDVPRSPWETGTPIYGVSVHPRYGGWFAFRGAVIFEGVELGGDELEFREPPDCVSGREKMIELLEKFNFHWQDWSYRDVLDTDITERYCAEQIEYFSTLPKDRLKLIQKWFSDK